MPSQIEIRQSITARIIQALERDEHRIPWQRPWTSRKMEPGRHCNVGTHRPYSGVNPILLQLHSFALGLTSRFWATWEQWKSQGCVVKKRPTDVPPGQWGCQIVLAKRVNKVEQDEESGDEQSRKFFLLRTFSVFNLDQVEGQIADALRDANHGEAVSPDFEFAERLIEATQAQIYFGGDKAFYVRPMPEDSWPHHTSGDYIQVPNRSQFRQAASYYETLFHELAHFAEVRTGWQHRKQGYALGELVAELVAVNLATELNLPEGEGMANHVAYVRHWLDAMKADPSFVFRAASQASRVTEFLLSFVRPTETVTDENTVAAF